MSVYQRLRPFTAKVSCRFSLNLHPSPMVRTSQGRVPAVAKGNSCLERRSDRKKTPWDGTKRNSWDWSNNGTAIQSKKTRIQPNSTEVRVWATVATAKIHSEFLDEKRSLWPRNEATDHSSPAGFQTSWCTWLPGFSSLCLSDPNRNIQKLWGPHRDTPSQVIQVAKGTHDQVMLLWRDLSGSLRRSWISVTQSWNSLCRRSIEFFFRLQMDRFHHSFFGAPYHNKHGD